MKHFSFKHCHHHSTASLNRKRQALHSKVAQNRGISGASNLERPSFKTIFLGMLCSTSPAEEASPYPIIKHMYGAKGRRIVGQSRQSREQLQEDLRLFDMFRDSRFLLTNDNPDGVGQPAYLAVFERFLFVLWFAKSKRYSRANGRNRKRWERGVGRMVCPLPIVSCFDLARMLLAKHTKKPPAAQARGEREPRKWEAGGVDGGKGGGKREGNVKR